MIDDRIDLPTSIPFLVEEQCKTAGICPWNNNWGNIHDFTPTSEGKNYSLLDQVERENTSSFRLFILRDLERNSVEIFTHSNGSVREPFEHQ